MKQQPMSISPIKAVDSFQQITPQNRCYYVWKLMGQVLDLHNSLNEVRHSVSEINNLWKNSYSQLETCVSSIMSTFRGLMQAKDIEIQNLKKRIQNLTNDNHVKQKQKFNKCMRGSILQELQQNGVQVFVQNSQQPSSTYLQNLQKQVQIIKEKLALLDSDEALGSKLLTIREVTQLCTSREEQDLNIKQKYQAMLKQQGNYDYQQDLQILKNFNLESTKVFEVPSRNSSQVNHLKQTKSLRQNKQNILANTNQKILPEFKPTQTMIYRSNQVVLQFPACPKVTLVSLSQVKPNISSQTQQYIGNYTYSGGFDQNCQKHGYGILKKSNKQIYVGNWKKGQFDGWGKLNLQTSKFLQYSGEFKNGSFHGRGTLLYKNGDKYIGNIVQNKIHGEGTLHKQNDLAIYGIWEENILIKRY